MKKDLVNLLTMIKLRHVIFTVSFLLIAYIRIHGITLAPPGFYKDEAGIAVNGYSILATGKDEYNRFLPLFFENFGDYKEPIFIYSQLPVMLVLGESILATRITSAIWGLATVVAFLYLIKLILKKNTIVFSALLVLGLMPWHVHFSRIGFQLITLPFFFTLFLIFFYQLVKTNKVKYLNRIALILGFMFYTYYAGRYLGILYAIFVSVMLRKKIPSKYFVRAGLIFAIILLPAFIWNEFFPGTFSSRFDAVSIIQTSTSFKQTLNLYISGYLQHYSLDFWFFKGDTNIRHSVQFHYPLIWSLIPIAITGLYTLIRKRQQPFTRLILLTLLTFPAVSALTKDAPHIHRIIFMVPVVGYILVVGLKEIFILIRRRSYVFQYLLTTIWFIFIIFESVELYSYYFNDYVYRAKTWFHVQDLEGIHQLLKYPKPHIISKSITEYWLSSYHLLAKTPPRQIQLQTSQVYSENIELLTTYRSGYYLVKNDECTKLPELAKAASMSVTLVESIDRLCILQLGPQENTSSFGK